MLVKGIKSRPEYKGITIDPLARRHLFALEGEGALALLEQRQGLTAGPSGEVSSPPSAPSGHLPLRGGDRLLHDLPTTIPTAFVELHGKRTISPLEGEMSASLTEGGEELKTVHPIAFGLTDDILARSEILYVAGAAAPKAYDKELENLNPDMLWTGPTIATLLFRLRGSLANAKMGTRFYIAGTEGFIGQSMQIALNMGMDFHSIPTEHRGSEMRRIQCVHCKGFTDNVRTNPVGCSHCGLSLLVRDHYSRRLGAFQGVCIDAEEPGTAPEPEEMFL